MVSGGHLQRCQVEDSLAGVAALGQGVAPGGLEVVLPLGLHHVLLHQHALHKQQSLSHVTAAARLLHGLQHVGMPRQPCLPLHSFAHVCNMPASYVQDLYRVYCAVDHYTTAASYGFTRIAQVVLSVSMYMVATPMLPVAEKKHALYKGQSWLPATMLKVSW